MKSLFQKSTALLLSLLVLLATTSVSANTHYCGKRLVSVEINKVAKSCFSKFTKGKKEKKSEFKIAKKSCCKDLSVFKKGSNDVLKIKNDVDVKIDKFKNKLIFTNSEFFKTSFLTLINPYYFTVNKDNLTFQYIEDRTVLFQVFLI